MSPTARDRALLAARAALVLLVVLAPWPFGSVTPRFASLITAVLTLLGGFVVAVHLLSSARLPVPPAWRFLAAGLALVALQQLPWPSSVTALVAPGVDDAHASAGAALELETFWRPLTVEPFETRWNALGLLGLVLAFYVSYVLFSHGARGRARHALGYLIAAAGVALSLFAVYQHAVFGTVLYGRFPTASGTPFGPFVNHNHFAGYVEAAGLVTLGMALGCLRRHGALALLLFGAAGVMAVAHVLSESRGGLVAAAGGLAALAWVSRGGDAWQRRASIGAGVAVVAFLLAFAPGSVAERWTGLGDGDDSVSFRARLWSDSIGLALTSPVVGTGLGTYAAVIPAHRSGLDETRAEYAESDWMQILCETGVVGFTLALGFVAAVLWTGYRAVRSGRSGRSRGLAEGAFAAAVALALHALVDFNFHIPSNALLAAVLLGLLPERAPGGVVLERRPARLGAAGLAVLLAAAAAAYALLLGESRELARRVDPVLTDASELTPVIRELARSRELVPSNPRTAFLLGRLYNEEAYRAPGQDRYRELRLGQASAAFHDAIALAPSRGGFWFELAWTEANRGNDDVADRLFPRALELEPHWANLRANYALYLASRGRLDDAFRQLQFGRELEPGLEPLDALRVVGPYLDGDRSRLRRAAGQGAEADAALSRYLAERGGSD